MILMGMNDATFGDAMVKNRCFAEDWWSIISPIFFRPIIIDGKIIDHQSTILLVNIIDGKYYLSSGNYQQLLHGGAPPVISWFIIPITIDITP